MGKIRAYSAAFAGATLILGALVGCSVSNATESSKPTASPEPTTTLAPEADPLTLVTTIVLRPETLDLNDESGSTVLSISYDAPAEKFVEALTVVIGSDPVVTASDGGNEAPPASLYDWSGLVVLDHEPATGTFPDVMNVAISASAAETGEGISISTVQGYRVGDATETIAAENGWTINANSIFEYPAEYGPVLGESADEAGDILNARAVAISAYPSVGPLQQIYAPLNLGVQRH